MNRRDAIRGLGTVAGGWLLAGEADTASPRLRRPGDGLDAGRIGQGGAGRPGPRDEGFWRDLRAEFQLPRDYAYLNTAGLGASPRAVTDQVKTMMDREEQAPSPGHSEQDWTRIRAKLAALLGPGCGGDEIALVSTATEGINIILNGLPLERGDEVITSTHEHVAVIIPLLHKMQTAGIVVKTFEPDLERARGNVERIEALMTRRTRLVFVSHVTCTTGQVFPAADIARVAAAGGAWFALDGAQSLAQFPIDIRASGADFYTASGHKWLLGPKRTGILYVRKARLPLLTPCTVGAYSDAMNSLADRRLELQPSAQRFEYGTQNDALVYGLEAAADFVSAIGLDAIWTHNRQLTDACAEALAQIPGVELLRPADLAARSAMVTFRLAGRDNRQVANALTGRRLRVRSVTEAGLDAVRASFHVCNAAPEVDRLIGAVRDLAAARTPGSHAAGQREGAAFDVPVPGSDRHARTAGTGSLT